MRAEFGEYSSDPLTPEEREAYNEFWASVRDGYRATAVAVADALRIMEEHGNRIADAARKRMLED